MVLGNGVAHAMVNGMGTLCHQAGSRQLAYGYTCSLTCGRLTGQLPGNIVLSPTVGQLALLQNLTNHCLFLLLLLLLLLRLVQVFGVPIALLLLQPNKAVQLLLPWPRALALLCSSASNTRCCPVGYESGAQGRPGRLPLSLSQGQPTQLRQMPAAHTSNRHLKHSLPSAPL